MNRSTRFIALIAFTITAIISSSITYAGPEVGKSAPDFTIKDTMGNQVALAELRGKTVVLEWTNHGCPYVRKHYDSGNMQALQKEATSDEVVWLSIISSAEGKQGYVSPEEANTLTKDRGAAPTHVLLDADGSIGQSYGARTTPHMFVINPAGELVYMGGIDDKATANQADIEGAENFVRSALSDLKAGNAVVTPTSRPYGCSVKYSS